MANLKRRMSANPQFDGIIALNKPSGPSSARCLYPFKKQGQKKIGHGGTLDPMASGVLTILLGQATKLSGWLLADGKKIYSGRIRLGIETDTWDIEGETVAERDCSAIKAADAEAVIKSWTGRRDQEVPPYSAAKHNGQPLYKLARKGHDTPVKRKSVTVYEAAMLDFSLPFVDFRVACGSGAYIRSLAHSLGKRLGCGAALSRLTREYSSPFGLDRCVSLAEIETGLKPDHVIPLMEAMPEWPRISLESGQIRDLRNGVPIAARPEFAQGALAFLCAGETPMAIGRLSGLKWRVERGLWNN